MSAIYVLIPLAMLVLALSVWLFFWAVKRGQFDDLDSPGHSILFEEERPVATNRRRQDPTVTASTDEPKA